MRINENLIIKILNTFKHSKALLASLEHKRRIEALHWDCVVETDRIPIGKLYSRFNKRDLKFLKLS